MDKCSYDESMLPKDNHSPIISSAPGNTTNRRKITFRKNGYKCSAQHHLGSSGWTRGSYDLWVATKGHHQPIITKGAFNVSEMTADHSRLNKNFPFNQNYPARSVQS